MPFSFLSRKHRRISIEIHRIMIGDPKSRKSKSAEQLQEGTDYYEECIMRYVDECLLCEVFYRFTLFSHFVVCGCRILGPPKKDNPIKKGLGKSPDEATTAADSDEESVADSAFADEGVEDTPDYSGWKVKYRLPIETFSIRKVHKNRVAVVIQFRTIKQNRDVLFYSEEEAQEFIQLVEVQKQAGERRSAAKLQAALSGMQVDPKQELNLLVEIVSGWDLPAADLTSSDPYVVAFMRGFEVHRTKHIPKT